MPGFVPSQPSSAYVLSGRLGTVAGRLPSWHLHSTIRCRNVSEIASTDSGDIVTRGAQAVAPFLPLLFSGQLLFPHQLARLLELHQGARGIAHTVSQEVAPRHSHSSSAYAWAQSAGKLSGRLSRHHCLHCDLLVSCRSRASKRASLNGRLHSTRRVQHQGLYPR